MAIKHVETGARTPITILVTGFGAFPGAPSNPTAAILDKLDRQRKRLARLGLALETHLLPVVFDEIGPRMERAAARKPDAILHLGLAGRRRAVSIETRAINRAGPLHPDAARRRAGQVLRPGGPTILKATYPAARISAAIRANGIKAQRSIDAGDYVCNVTLYLTLYGRLASFAGFLHVPKTRKPLQPLHRVRRQRPSLADLTKAVMATVLILGREARQSRTSSLQAQRSNLGAGTCP